MRTRNYKGYARSHPGPFGKSKQGGTSWVTALLLIAISAVIFLPSSKAQTTSTGAITGRTWDPSGALIPGVTLKLKQKGHPETQSAVSDASGRFGFLLLQPGDYELEAERSGFRTGLVPDLHVVVTENVSLELHMQL